ALQWRAAARVLRQADATVEGDPAHRLGVHEVTRVAAPFPDPAVRLVPLPRRALDDVLDERPHLVVGRFAPLVPAPREVQELAQRVELALPRRAVADAHRAEAPPALPPVELLLGHPPLSPDAVKDPPLIGIAACAALHEAAHGVGRVREAEPG